jgi:hypothetical protein
MAGCPVVSEWRQGRDMWDKQWAFLGISVGGHAVVGAWDVKVTSSRQHEESEEQTRD